MFAQVGDDQSPAAMLVRALDPCREHGMILRRIRSNDEHETSLLDIRNRTRVSTVTHRALQPHGCWVLAVAGTVVDIVRADYCPRKLLHQEALLSRALRRSDKRQCIRTMLGPDPLEVAFNDVQRLGPFDLAEAVSIAQQRLRQPVVRVDVPPGELALD